MARLIRQYAIGADTPTLAITAQLSTHERTQLLGATFAAVLLKPIYPAQVVTAVQGFFAVSDGE